MRSFFVAVAVATGTLGLANTAGAQTYSYWAGGAPATSGYVAPSYDPYVSNPYMYNPYASNPYVYNRYASNPYAYNPYASNPYTYNPYASNPYVYNAVPYVYTSSSGRNYRRWSRRY